MRVYRVFERKNAAIAFTGEGAQRYGGRWNSSGVAVVYAASNFALALLEIMANARRGRIPPDMMFCAVDIPDEVVIGAVPQSALPKDWHGSPAPPETQAIGNAFVRDGKTVGLWVPSAVSRIEQNMILNPNHADFSRLIIGEIQDVPMDKRLQERKRKKNGA